jgi:hypothetical protein
MSPIDSSHAIVGAGLTVRPRHSRSVGRVDPVCCKHRDLSRPGGSQVGRRRSDGPGPVSLRRSYNLAMADNPMKSSVELAMERLRKKDADEGVVTRPLSDEDRTAIAEVKNFYDAKLAEQEVLHQAAMRQSVDPAERELLDQQFRRDRERFTSERDRKVEKLRQGVKP